MAICVLCGEIILEHQEAGMIGTDGSEDSGLFYHLDCIDQNLTDQEIRETLNLSESVRALVDEEIHRRNAE